jgi:pimeloyl-ACP methyl ester carboxylesterase
MTPPILRPGPGGAFIMNEPMENHAKWAGVDPATMTLAHTLTGRPDGQVVLFIHGITGSRNYFLKKARPLAEEYRLLLPDLPGFGDSPKPRTDYNIQLFRDTVRNTVVAAGCHQRKIHIVGHSLGGLIALEYAAMYPDHVGRLALVSLPRFHDPEVAHEYFWQGSPSYRRLLNEHSLRRNLAQWRRSGLGMAVQYMFRFPLSVIRDSRKYTLNSLTSTLEHCLLNYRVDEVFSRQPHLPILMLHGRLDQVAPLANVRDLPDRHENIRLVEIDGSGHHIFLTHTRRCLDLISTHLAGEPAPARPAPAQDSGILSDPA